MHYYQFHIGDYASHTRHLSLMEDLAYRRLLDFYYLHESPIKQRDIARQIGMRDNEQDVLTVLNEFFMSTDEGFVSPRADKEIEHYHSKVEQASRAGKASAERRLNTRLTDVQTDVQPTINHKPLTNNHIKTQRGTRLPADWSLPDSWKMWAKANRPDLNPIDVAASFYDYWISKPGSGGVKLNWEATWRNWVRSQKQSFGKPLDLIHQTTPTPSNQDAALRKIEEDSKKATKPNAEMQAKINELLNRKVV